MGVGLIGSWSFWELGVITDYNSPVHIEASAPTRIDLAGGTLDIWPLYLFHDGAQTLNAAISLRARCSIRAADRPAAS